MTGKPLVSVVINAYNGERYLREAIESVYAQTLQDFEIVLFDDASTDSTPLIAREFDERLRYARSDVQVPLGEARNRALELARGEFIAFLDQDDLFLPKKLERQVAAFRGDVALVFSNSLSVWEGTGRQGVLYAERPPDGAAFRALLRRYYLSINTVMISRSALPADRAWWFPSDFRMCEETDLFLRLAYAHPVAYVDEVLAKYRIHGGNFSLHRGERLLIETGAMLRRLAESIPDFSTTYAAEIADFRGDVKRSEARLRWGQGRRASAWRAYAEGLALRPHPAAAAELLMSLAFPFSAYAKLRGWLGRPVA